MRLIKYTHEDGQEEWFWINRDEVTVSPRYPSKEAAEKFYFSEYYQAAKAIRDTGCDTDLMIIEGM